MIGKEEFNWNGNVINLAKPIRSISMAEAVLEKTGIDFREDIPFEKAVELAKEHKVPLQKSWNNASLLR